MKTITHTSYVVASADGNSWFSSNGYSKYHERLTDPNIAPEDVYGFEQAMDHARELREFIYDGKISHANDVLIIRAVTTITTSIELPAPVMEGLYVLVYTKMHCGVQERKYKNEFGDNIEDRKNALRFADAKSAMEWKKQQGIYGDFNPVLI